MPTLCDLIVTVDSASWLSFVSARRHTLRCMTNSKPHGKHALLREVSILERRTWAIDYSR